MMGSNFCWWGSGHFFGGPWGIVFGTIFWLLVIAGIIYVIIKYAKKPEGGRNEGETALDILKKRYARGGIDAIFYNIAEGIVSTVFGAGDDMARFQGRKGVVRKIP
jgi:uncharacterized membrane protein